MGRLFTREALPEVGCFVSFLGAVAIVVCGISGRWPTPEETWLILGMGFGFWVGRFGRDN